MLNLKPHRRVMVLAFVLMSLMTAVVAAGTVGTIIIGNSFDEVIDSDVPRLDRLVHLDRDLFRGQRSLEIGLLTNDPEEQKIHLAEYRRQIDRTAARWDSYLEVSADQSDELQWQNDYTAARSEWLSSSQALAMLVTNKNSLDDAAVATLLPATQRDFATMRSAVDDLEERVAEPLIESSTESVRDSAELIMTVLLVLMFVGLLAGSSISVSTYRAARRQYLTARERDLERSDDAERNLFQTELNQALEMAQTESAALDSIRLVLDREVGNRPVEVLLADSSQAHLEQVLKTDLVDHNAGCPVQTPSECPAIRRGTTHTFIDGSAYSACPNLRDRGDVACSAVCVPVSIAGRTVGVLHATGPNLETLDPKIVAIVEKIADRTGDRIGVLRAFAKSQTQASTDPLTGLANRRSFENEVSEKLHANQSLAIAYGDLDCFKNLNDTYGHDAGDRALRLFSRVVRDSLRELDIAARWGGEEFVIMFGGSNASTARAALDRIRQNLLIAISSGTTPPFTVSFGVTDTNMGTDLEELINLADEALLSAKNTGRDRVVIAGRDERATSDSSQPAGDQAVV